MKNFRQAQKKNQNNYKLKTINYKLFLFSPLQLFIDK
jgi:hypothetical protein